MNKAINGASQEKLLIDSKVGENEILVCRKIIKNYFFEFSYKRGIFRSEFS
jgi:hypothetical protein